MEQQILAEHFARYPQMEPQDAVKLLYQNEFGPGHMLPRPEKALAYLRQEMAGLAPGPENEPLYESIGNGLCRLNLRPCAAKGIPQEEICRLFCEAVQAVQGDPRAFRKKLRALEEMAERDETPFSPAELDYYLILYEEKGRPAVHHSAAYQRAYAPAYRVVQQKRLRDYLKLLRNEEK